MGFLTSKKFLFACLGFVIGLLVGPVTALLLVFTVNTVYMMIIPGVDYGIFPFDLSFIVVLIVLIVSTYLGYHYGKKK